MDIFQPKAKFKPWGKDNKTPDYIVDFYDSIPEHSSAIDFVEANLMGLGLNIEVLNYWTLKKIVLDYILFGGFTLQIIKQRNGTAQYEYIDISKTRISEDEKQLAYTEDWNKVNPEIKWIDIVTNSNKDGVFYFKK